MFLIQRNCQQFEMFIIDRNLFFDFFLDVI